MESPKKISLSPSQETVTVVLLRLVGVACQAFIVALVANSLTVSDMGYFSAVYVFWGLVRMLGAIGLDQVALREIAFARARNDAALAGALTWHSNIITARLGLGIALATGAILFVLAGENRISLTVLEFVAIVLAVPAYALLTMLAAAVRGYDRNIASQGVESICLHLVTLVILLIHWSLADLTLGAVLCWQAACAWGATAAYWQILRPSLGGNFGIIPRNLKSRIWRESLEAWQALLLIGLGTRVPTYICFTLLGPAATAILEIAIRFGTLPTIFTSAVSTTFAPTMAKQYANKEWAALGTTLAVSSWLAFVPSACTLLGAALLGPWLLDVFFPPDYQLAYLPLLMVIASSTVNGGFGMSSTVLFMTGHQRVVRIYSLLQLVAVLALGCGLGPLFGVNGVAFAVLVGFIVMDVGLAMRVKPLLHVTGILRPDGLGNLVRTLRGERLAPMA